MKINQKQRIHKKLIAIRKEMIVGDFERISANTGISFPDISRCFSGQLKNTDKPLKVMLEAQKILNEREKLIA